MQLLKRSRTLADSFLNFVNYAISPYHVVNWCRDELQKNGFTELKEVENWSLERGKKYFFTRNLTTVVAFHVGQQFASENTAFKVIGTHTDSPCLKIAPVSKHSYKSIEQCHVSIYGGGLWHTWFDRDLLLGGKVVYKDGDRLSQVLWKSKHPLMKIPNLAIHLSNSRDKFEPNKETHIKPISESLVGKDLIEKINSEPLIFTKHSEGLVTLIAKDSSLKAEDIVDFDLYFADANPSCYTGINEDFISSARLDNLFSTFHAVKALIAAQNKGSSINIAALFDHQECGSQSAQGAGSNILMTSLKRIFKVLCNGNPKHCDDFEKAMQKSFVISADMAHAVHPNYSSHHHNTHQVQMNKGCVIKINHNQRYATDIVSSSILKAIAKKVDTPIQEFMVKNDSLCGSTIGPIIASKTGIKNIDVGMPMLGMHSIRETCGVIDGAYYSDLFKGFYDHYEAISHDLMDG